MKDFDSEKDWRNIPELRMTIEKKIKNEKIQDKKLFDFIVKYFSTKSENYEICMDGDYPIPDKDLDDYEYIPLNQDIEEYFQKEVKPFVNDGQISIEKPLIGYEIPFTKIFWKYEQIRDKEIIADEIELLDNEIINSTKKILGRDEK